MCISLLIFMDALPVAQYNFILFHFPSSYASRYSSFVMDGAASALGLVGVALQLADSVQKLVEFWKLVKDAPAEISTLFLDLQLLSATLDERRKLGHLVPINKISDGILKICEGKVLKLQDKVAEAKARLNAGSGKKIAWAKFKIALNRSDRIALQKSITDTLFAFQISQQNTILWVNRTEIRGLQADRYRELAANSVVAQRETRASLESVRSLLHRAATHSCEGRVRSMLLIEQQVLVSSGNRATSLGPHKSKTSAGNDTSVFSGKCDSTDHKFACCNSKPVSEYHRSALVRKTESTSRNWNIFVKTPLAKVYSESRTRKILVKGSFENYTSYETNYNSLLYPPAWMNILPLSFGVQITARCTSGWEFSIEPFRVIPDDSLIFEFCREGNLSGVRSLLKRRTASPWDRDAAGRTPLWVSEIEYTTHDFPS